MDLVVVLVLGLLLGAAAGWVLGRSRSADTFDPELVEARHQAVVAQVRHEEAGARAEVESRLAAAQASVDGLRDQLVQVQEQQRQTVESHREETRRREQSAQSESKVLQQLAPVAAQLKDMQQKVVDLEKQRHQQHGDLAAQIRATRESAEKSQSAAETLSAALRNNSVRGAYGETQLKSLVESAGLLRRVDFTTQESITAETGLRRPDMVVRLPGGKEMAVDAKVPYSAFIDAHGPDLDDARRAQLFTQHAKQVKAHVDALADKGYWTGLSASPEFTVAFIPNDAILNAALDADPSLMEHAFARGIVLATPVNLWAVLKTVSFTWQQDVLTENAKELFDLGNELYGRLAKMSEYVGKLGRSIEGTVKSYNDFVGSLERRVLVTARKFDQLDESKVIAATPVVEAQTRRLDQPEMAALEQMGVERPELDFGLFADDDTDEAEQAG